MDFDELTIDDTFKITKVQVIEFSPGLIGSEPKI